MLAFFFQFREHDNRFYFVFQNHLKKMWNGVNERTFEIKNVLKQYVF
jgi:penicillin-binding protein-related factor A (putative recombinase)